MLPDLIERGRHPSVGITVHKATITLRVTAQAASEQGCLAAMEPTIETIRSCLGELVFGEEDDELQHAIVRLLRDRQERLTTIEWGPAGLLAQWLGEADPDGAVFAGGSVVRDAVSLAATLDESAGSLGLDDWGAVVSAMAQAIQKRYRSEHALSVGPFPSSDAIGTPGGQLHFALAGPADTVAKSVPFSGHPDILRERAVKQALNLLRLALLG
jgi:nicotinamide-nucleotide amidase